MKSGSLTLMLMVDTASTILGFKDRVSGWVWVRFGWEMGE